MAFTWVKSLNGTRDVIREGNARSRLVMGASLTITKGDALKFTNGKLAKIAATDLAEYVALETKTSASATEDAIKVVSVSGSLFEVGFTPLANDVAAASNSTATAAICALAGSNSDLVGGLLYCKELDETRVITANTYGGGNCTFTVGLAFSRAITTGDTVRAVGFGFGTTALKGDSTNPHSNISNVAADVTGGKIAVYDVDMAKKKAIVYFRP